MNIQSAILAMWVKQCTYSKEKWTLWNGVAFSAPSDWSQNYSSQNYLHHSWP